MTGRAAWLSNRRASRGGWRTTPEVGVEGHLDGAAEPASPPDPVHPTKVRWAVTAIAGLGALTFAGAAAVEAGRTAWLSPGLVAPYLFAVLLVAGELRPLVVARKDGETDTVTVSTTFALALILSGPLILTMVAQALAVAYDDIVRRRQYFQAMFNIGQYLLTLAITRLVFCSVSGRELLGVPGPLTPADIGASLLAGVTFFAANNGLVAVIVALSTGQRPWSIIRGDVTAQGLATSILIGLAPVTAIVADFSLLTVPLVVLPLIGVQHSAYLAARRQFEALHDGLTGLPNRTLLHLRADAAVEQATAPGRPPVAVMLLDLDHFKEVNDTLGHHVGDAVLVEVADRLRRICPPEVTVSRLGGDEFAVLVPDADPDAVRLLAERLAEALRAPAVVEGVRIAIQSSIGVAIAPTHARSVAGLLQRADIALYRAKEARGTVEVYREELDTHTVERLNLVADLHTAVSEDQLFVVFQPIVDAATRTVVGLEALLRWAHPVHGLIPPGEFIALAERSGAISAMSHHAMDLALGSAGRLRARGHDLSMAVNLSARLLSDLELPDIIVATLARHDVPATRLTVEVTESAIAADPKRALWILQQVRELGVRLSVDDFGTGYSSLEYLSRLRPDELKVDRSFVATMSSDRQGEAIVRSTIELGHALGMCVTAEGVEDEATYRALLDLGCDRIQGFLLGRPVPEGELVTLLPGPDRRQSAAVEALR
jgi:diguanylate cyclase (GGDEF)-like protein